MLEEIGQIVTGKTPSSNVIGAFSSSGIPFVTPKDMDGRRWIETTERYLSEAGRQSLKNYLIPKDSVAVSCIGSDMGKAILLKKDSVTNQQINTIIVDASKHNPKYIYYVLSLKQEELKSIAGGSATPILNKGHFSKVVIELPDKVDQDNIVQVLDSLDCKIELNNQINQNLESMAQAMFKSWFIDFDPVRAKIAAKQEGKDSELAAMCAISGKSEAELEQMAKEDFAELQATAALFPDELVESELGEVPKGWEVTRFSNIVEKYIDNRGKTPPIQSEGIPLLEVKHLPEFSLNPDLNTDKKVSLETFNTWFRAHLQENDLIMSTVGTIGRLCIVPANRTLAIAQNILGLRFKLNKVNPLFMYYQMNSAKFRNDVDARLVITVQSSIKRKDLETIDLLQPDINIQNIFAEKIKPFVLSQQSDESLKLINIRDALLPKLLSGEVEVENL